MLTTALPTPLARVQVASKATTGHSAWERTSRPTGLSGCANRWLRAALAGSLCLVGWSSSAGSPACTPPSPCDACLTSGQAAAVRRQPGVERQGWLRRRLARSVIWTRTRWAVARSSGSRSADRRLVEAATASASLALSAGPSAVSWAGPGPSAALPVSRPLASSPPSSSQHLAEQQIGHSQGHAAIIAA